MPATIGIRREDKNRWERRVPVVPKDMERLIREAGLAFIVQPSPIRAFKDDAYASRGAELNEDLSQAGVILAIKEIPVELLEPSKTYVFFAHVIKGQSHNMPLLQQLLNLGATLVDYERIADDRGRRLVFFGREAGHAGMIESLVALGKRLAWEGYESPFGEIKPPHFYGDLSEAKVRLKEIGLGVRSGLDPDLCPLIIGLSGYGHVSQGAQEILDLFPHEEIDPEDLLALYGRSNPPRDRLFKVVFREEHLVEPARQGADFDLQDYYDNPGDYRGVFARYLPALTMLVNCIYWTDAYPRLITRAQARELWTSGRRTLRVIGDISCDIEGAVEFTHEATSPDNPIYVYDPIEGRWRDGVAGRGIVVMAVDNLPCELPRDSSAHFSGTLADFIPSLARADWSLPFEKLDLPAELKRAVITHQGRLTPDYRYLDAFLPDS